MGHKTYTAPTHLTLSGQRSRPKPWFGFFKVFWFKFLLSVRACDKLAENSPTIVIWVSTHYYSIWLSRDVQQRFSHTFKVLNWVSFVSKISKCYFGAQRCKICKSATTKAELHAPYFIFLIYLFLTLISTQRTPSCLLRQTVLWFFGFWACH